jgi:hypothetical protein
MSRTTPPETCEDALLLDNSLQTIDESVAQVLDWWQGKQLSVCRVAAESVIRPYLPLALSARALVVWFITLTRNNCRKPALAPSEPPMSVNLRPCQPHKLNV